MAPIYSWRSACTGSSRTAVLLDPASPQWPQSAKVVIPKQTWLGSRTSLPAHRYRQIGQVQLSRTGGSWAPQSSFPGAVEKLGMSICICFARSTRKHRRLLSSGLFLSADSPRRTRPRSGLNHFAAGSWRPAHYGLPQCSPPPAGKHCRAGCPGIALRALPLSPRAAARYQPWPVWTLRAALPLH